MSLPSVGVRAGATASAAALCLLVVNAQQPPPTFRAGVEAVVLDVSVLDKDRRPVRGLTVVDFTILEDGRPQAVRTFKAIDFEDVVDVTAASWTREVAPDIRKNDDLGDRRVVVIVMDSSTPMKASEVQLARRLGRRVVEGLSPNDLVAVVYTFGKSYGQNLTLDRPKLLAAVDRFNGGSDLAAPPGMVKPFNQYDPTASSLYFSTLSTLRGVAEGMAALPERRKALVFVSVGVPLDVSKLTELVIGEGIDTRGTAAELVNEMTETFAAAQRANVSIYGVDPGGLRGEAAPLNQDFLKTVSASTGGFTITDTNSLTSGIEQIYRENSSYYLLGYQSSNERSNGRFRKVEVKVNRPGISVRARNGYFEATRKAAAQTAKSAGTASSAVAALEGIAPKSDIPLRVHAVPFAKGNGAKSEVAIVLQGREPIATGSTATADDLKVLVHAYNLRAELKASESLTVRLGIRQGAARDLSYGVLSRLTLDPGRYQVRLATVSSMLGKSGSVYFDLDVPDYTKPAISLSGVMFEVVPSPIAAPKGKLVSLIPIVPTAERDFVTGDTVTAFSRIYQGRKDALLTVTVTTRIVDRTGTQEFSKTETVSADRFSERRSADLLVSVPVGTLTPGPHLLSVTVSNGTVSARQEVRFTAHPNSGG